MRLSRRRFAGIVLGASAAGSLRGGRELAGPKARYARFEARGRRGYGVVEGRAIRALDAAPWAGGKPTDFSAPLEEAKLLCPSEPSNVLAMAGNYRSHLGDTPAPKNPEAFFKGTACLVGHEAPIAIPPGTSDVHYEGELVVVIGRLAKDVSPAEAASYVFGFTCGNDVSARDWQENDRQWWRAKGSDSFGPVGPWIAAGIDADDLRLATRLNGRVVQEARTSELIFGVPGIVSFLSRHIALRPGDLIFTGTPGTTGPMESGDVVEVEIEGVGVLRNRVA